MKIITERDAVKAAILQFYKVYAEYGHDDPLPWDSNGTFRYLRRSIGELDPETATAEELSTLIGAGTEWGVNRCGRCGGKRPELLVYYVLPGRHQEQRGILPARICEDCLAEADRLLARCSKDPDTKDDTAPAPAGPRGFHLLRRIVEVSPNGVMGRTFWEKVYCPHCGWDKFKKAADYWTCDKCCLQMIHKNAVTYKLYRTIEVAGQGPKGSK